MHVYHAEDAVILLQGDAFTVSSQLPDGCVDCIVTSPPYFGLRDYGIEGQYGLESSPVEYVENLRKVFSELRRVLADDGTLWLNLGDSYYSGRGNPGPNSADEKQPSSPKNLLGIPWRTAFALQDDGWILRNEIVWAKKNAMPESVKDRFNKRHEHIFFFAKSKNYYFDLDAVREPYSEAHLTRVAPHRAQPGGKYLDSRDHPYAGKGQSFAKENLVHPGGKNPGDVWQMPTVPFPEAHFAVYPPELPRRCILAGCKSEGTVLDPFHGSGTTGMVARELDRNYIGIDLNPEYLELSLRSPKRFGVSVEEGA